MNMNLRPDTSPQYIDLKRHLPDLKASLTPPPDERKFEPLATERFSDDTRHPGDDLFLLAVEAFVTGVAIIAYFLH